MFNSPYQTTIGSKYHNLQSIIKSIEEAKVLGHLETNLIDGFSCIEVLLKKDEHTKNIPNFNHPILIPSTTGSDKPIIVIDLRPFSNEARKDNQGNIIFPSFGPASLQITRAKLQYYWETTSKLTLKSFNLLPLTVYGHWVAEAISRSCSLSPEAQLSVNILTSYFYICLFIEDEEQISNSQTEIALSINRTTRIPTSKVMEVLDMVNGIKFNNIREFSDWLAKSDISPRLQKFNSGLMVQILATSWFGSTIAREIVALSIEYPPTFIAILSQAVTERMYKKTPIAQVADRFTKKQGELLNFNNGLQGIISAIRD